MFRKFNQGQVQAFKVLKDGACFERLFTGRSHLHYLYIR